MNASLCNDDRLHVLLSEDEASDQFRAVARHVESCETCQKRLTTLAGDAEWWSDAHQFLQTSDEPRWEPDASWTATFRSDQEPQDRGPSLEAVRNILGAPAHPELLGRLGRYDIERVIGSGGCGIVFKAHDSELNRPVAIKTLATHLAHVGAARQRFAREGRAAAAVVHEHVVAIYNVESDGAVPFLVMQYVPGRSLQARVDEDGPLAVEEVLRIGVQAAAGLAAAHRQGLVHRDVKPSNILLEDTVERAVLTDFGLARAMDDASLTQTGVVAGTPHYMSPEQATGQVIDHRSDLFSLGSVLYFMAAGRPPFRATGTLAVLNRICHESHRPLWQLNSAIPDELIDVIDRLLEKKPGRRFANAEEVGQRLAGLLSRAQQQGLGRRRFRVLRARRWRRAIVATAGLALVAAMLFAAQAWINRPATQSDEITPKSLPALVDDTVAQKAVEPLAIDQVRTMWQEVKARNEQLTSQYRETLGAAQSAGAATSYSQRGDDSWQREVDQMRLRLIELEADALRSGAMFAPNVEGIYSAWQGRQRKIGSLRIKWTGSVAETPGGPGAGLGAEKPQQLVANERSAELLLDGDKLRYSWNGPAWSDERTPPGFYPKTYFSASDGTIGTSFFGNPGAKPSQAVHPVGFILESGENQDARDNYHVEPILFFARALDPVLGCTKNLHNRPPKGGLRLEYQDLDGTFCAVMTEQFSRYQRQVWVDPERDCVITHYVVSLDGKPSYQIDTKYAAHEKLGWAPSSWQVQRWLPAGERLFETISARVTSLEIDPKIDAEEFRPSFPAGTMVRNARDDVDYLVLPDGKSRFITKEERKRGVKYEVLMNTKTGEGGI